VIPRHGVAVRHVAKWLLYYTLIYNLETVENDYRYLKQGCFTAFEHYNEASRSEESNTVEE